MVREFLHELVSILHRNPFHLFPWFFFIPGRIYRSNRDQPIVAFEGCLEVIAALMKGAWLPGEGVLSDRKVEALKQV